ncbi:Uncharacterised protein [Psychrobacter phenylpyruvicus]|uniref:Uncharacterized protein n=1 Tax=Psychrobacter phenylpyruvicus TaxID=29432 RepID=A0A379LPQ6_9GAMM|nr:Uncharacterised protein [Psychrobacter phenylpyruvicus]
MIFKTLLIPSVLITMLATGCQSTAFMASADNPIGSIASTPVSTTDGVRQVDTARWTKTGIGIYTNLLAASANSRSLSGG